MIPYVAIFLVVVIAPVVLISEYRENKRACNEN